MKRSVAYALCRAGRTAGLALLLLLVVGFLFQFLPALESRLLPVIKQGSFRTDRTESYIGTFCFRPRFIKQRDCRYLGMEWFAIDEEGYQSRVTWWDPLNMGLPYSRPQGPADGIRWCVEQRAEAKAYFGIVEHDCRLPWTTHTVLGPIDAPPTAE